MSNSQLNKFKSRIKNGTKVNQNFSSNLSGGSNDWTNFLQKILLTNTQLSRPREAFVNNSSANLKLSKTHLSKMGQSGIFLSRVFVFDEKCT